MRKVVRPLLVGIAVLGFSAVGAAAAQADVPGLHNIDTSFSSFEANQVNSPSGNSMVTFGDMNMDDEVEGGIGR